MIAKSSSSFFPPKQLRRSLALLRQSESRSIEQVLRSVVLPSHSAAICGRRVCRPGLLAEFLPPLDSLSVRTKPGMNISIPSPFRSRNSILSICPLCGRACSSHTCRVCGVGDCESRSSVPSQKPRSPVHHSNDAMRIVFRTPAVGDRLRKFILWQWRDRGLTPRQTFPLSCSPRYRKPQPILACIARSPRWSRKASTPFGVTKGPKIACLSEKPTPGVESPPGQSIASGSFGFPIADRGCDCGLLLADGSARVSAGIR